MYHFRAIEKAREEDLKVQPQKENNSRNKSHDCSIINIKGVEKNKATDNPTASKLTKKKREQRPMQRGRKLKYWYTKSLNVMKDSVLGHEKTLTCVPHTLKNVYGLSCHISNYQCL